MDSCFDSDVLIYAANRGHPLGDRVRAVLVDSAGWLGGSVLLLPEVLTKPIRANHDREAGALRDVLARLDLRPAEAGIADLAVSLGSRYGLRTIDAIHLATCVHVGADRFITNNRKDFDKGIAEVAVVFPEALPEPG